MHPAACLPSYDGSRTCLSPQLDMSRPVCKFDSEMQVCPCMSPEVENFHGSRCPPRRFRRRSHYDEVVFDGAHFGKPFTGNGGSILECDQAQAPIFRLLCSPPDKLASTSVIGDFPCILAETVPVYSQQPPPLSLLLTVPCVYRRVSPPNTSHSTTPFDREMSTLFDLQ